MNKIRKHISFAEKVRQREKTILYELLPPPKHLSTVDIDRSLSLFAAMLPNFPIDAINIPEVREETRNGVRANEELVKMEPYMVCSYLQKHGVTDCIVNRPIVYASWEEQEKWLQNTSENFGIKNIVLVGGESSKEQYPGLSVVDAATKITKEFPQILLGGITIPTRKNEAERVLKKSLAGIEFFTTQILYEPNATKEFLKAYSELCKKENIDPKMIFLSFAPITTPGDIKLLSWLGVDIPQQTQEVLTTGWFGIGWRSQQICQDILEDILLFVQKQNIRVPLGLNVEHVNRHNFETSFLLVERLSEVYLGRHIAERHYKFND